jgi:hypothetical protein
MHVGTECGGARGLACPCSWTATLSILAHLTLEERNGGVHGSEKRESAIGRYFGEAYRGDVLDQQLDDQAQRFINDPQRNRLDHEKGARLSSIFEWFESDFAAAAGSVADFVARYVDNSAQADALRRGGGGIEFLDYDWTLNAQVEPEGTRNGPLWRRSKQPGDAISDCIGSPEIHGRP